MFLPRFSEDDYEKVERFEDEEYNTELDDVMRNIDDLIGPEPADDDPDSRDTSAWDQRTSPILSPIAGPGEETRQSVPQSQASLPSPRPIHTTPPPMFPHLSPIPQGPSMYRGTKQKNTTSKVWGKLKKLFTRKFEGGDPLPKLSDRLVPEHDDRVKWFELFSEPQDPAKTRK